MACMLFDRCPSSKPTLIASISRAEATFYAMGDYLLSSLVIRLGRSGAHDYELERGGGE